MVPEKKCLGFTLPEVIIALLIIGIFLSFSGRFFTEQWRASQALKDKIEAHFSLLNSGKTVLDAIREAKMVSWNESQAVLSVVPGTQAVPDDYFIADLNYDGVKDLYIKHSGVSSPIASGLLNWSCVKGVGGLWTITLEAKVGGQIVKWQGSIRQRIDLNLVLSYF